MRKRKNRLSTVFSPGASLMLGFVVSSSSLEAMTITGYSAAAHNRFSSGYPGAPVANQDPSFVGLGLDWDGVGWDTTNATKSFGFLSPRHFMVARHYGGASNIRIQADGVLQTYSQQSVENTGYGVVFQNETIGDLSMGTLSRPVPAASGAPRYAVLDLNTSSASNSPSAYVGLSLLLYGRGPDAASSTRVGAASVSGVVSSGNNVYFTTTRDSVQLEGGDSGSPAFHVWTNPNGGRELTVMGNHAAINDTNNFINFTGTREVMAALNLLMNDEGFALRVAGNPTNTWVGSQNTSITDRRSWGVAAPGSAPFDRFVTFDAAASATVGSRDVVVNADHNLRGLYFRATAAAGDGFTFGGASVLTIGRGGVVNYDNSRQTFGAAVALGDAQYWDGGSGGITAGSINTNGRLLEITGAGVNRITGSVSGAGAIAVSGGRLEMTGDSSYSGGTWVHDGVLAVNNASGSATGTGVLRVAASAALVGAGTVYGPAQIAGKLAPGNSIGTLTVANDVTWDGGVAWEFELGGAAADFTAVSMGMSAQDQLRISGAGSDFLKGAGTVWRFDFLGTGANGWYRLVDWDGSTTFTAADFTAVNLAPGRWGEFTLDTTTSALYLQVIPEPGMVLPVLTGAVIFLFPRRRETARRRRC